MMPCVRHLERYKKRREMKLSALGALSWSCAGVRHVPRLGARNRYLALSFAYFARNRPKTFVNAREEREFNGNCLSVDHTNKVFSIKQFTQVAKMKLSNAVVRHYRRCTTRVKFAKFEL
jgi:hypothetical protein